MTTRHLLRALWATAACIPFVMTSPAMAQGGGNNQGPQLTTITIGQDVQGALDANDFAIAEGYWDIFEVELTAGENYQFTVNAQGFTPSIGVFTGDGNPVEDCLYEVGENSFTIQVATSGTYSVAVASQNQNGTGRYTLSSRSGAAAPTQRPGQNNDGNGGAGNGNNGELQPENLEPTEGTLNGESLQTAAGSYYSYMNTQLQAGTTYHFMIASEDLQLYLNLQDSQGNSVQLDATEDEGSYLRFTPTTTTGTYALLMVASQPNTTGNYIMLKWDGEFVPEFGDAPPQEEPSNEPNNPPQNNGPRPANNDGPMPEPFEFTDVSRQDSFFENLNDQDIALESGSFFGYHTVELTAGVTYTINIYADDFDAIGYLFDNENNQLATNDNGPDMGTHSQMIFTPETTGEYSVGISSAAPGKTGAYRIDVNSGPPIEDGPAPVTPGQDDAADDADGPTVYFHGEGSADADKAFNSADVHLEAGQTIVIETYGLSQGCDTLIELRRSTNPDNASPDDPVLANNDDNAGMLSSRIVFTAEEAGDYYVGVGVFEGGAGDFTLLIREALPARDPLVIENLPIPQDSFIIIKDLDFGTGPQTLVIETLDLANDCDTIIEVCQVVDADNPSDDDPILFSNDDFFSNRLESRIYTTIEEPVHYYIRIRNIGKNDGTCTLRIRYEQ